MNERAILFVDGNNWYHSLRATGMTDLARLDYAKISRKLVGPARQWVGTRYYIGQVNQAEEPAQYADQRRFFARLAAQDARITHHLGRLETRIVESDAARELIGYLNALPSRIDLRVYKDLVGIAQRHRRVQVKVEKAVDVLLAVELVSFAIRDQYDAAYLMSADGDLTPAVAQVRALNKKVFVASPSRGARLASEANAYIRIDKDWFKDCWI